MGRTIGLNSNQRIAAVGAQGNALTQNFVLVAAPSVGFRKKVKGSFRLDAYGSDTEVDIRAGGVTILSFIFGTDTLPAVKELPETVLEVGSFMSKVGDGSGNSTLRFNLSVESTQS